MIAEACAATASRSAVSVRRPVSLRNRAELLQDSPDIAMRLGCQEGIAWAPADLSQERIQRRPVLGGLISEYERAA